MIRVPTTSWRIACAAFLAALAACAEATDDQRTDTLDPNRAQQERAAMPAGLPEALDSGSAAFRAENMGEALSHYERATEIDPESAPAWFGVYMAQRALGNTAAAEEALRRTQELAPGASIIHPTDRDTLS